MIGRYSGVGRYNFIPTLVKTTYSKGRYNFIPTDALLVQRLIPTLMVSAMRGCGIVLDWTKKNDSISNRKICVHPVSPWELSWQYLPSTLDILQHVDKVIKKQVVQTAHFHKFLGCNVVHFCQRIIVLTTLDPNSGFGSETSSILIIPSVLP